MIQENIENVQDNKIFEIIMENDEFISSSLAIAVYFEEEHDNVLAAIEAAISELPDTFYSVNFKLMSNNPSKEPIYMLTREGINYICMGFTGKKATLWKTQFIKVFSENIETLNTMKRKLRIRNILLAICSCLFSALLMACIVWRG